MYTEDKVDNLQDWQERRSGCTSLKLTNQGSAELTANPKSETIYATQFEENNILDQYFFCGSPQSNIQNSIDITSAEISNIYDPNNPLRAAYL